MASRIRLSTRGLPASARETVETCTPAMRATSAIFGAAILRRVMPRILRARLGVSAIEHRDVDSLGHYRVAGVVGMNVIAAVEIGAQPLGAFGVPRDGIEVDDRVELLGGAD